jgi:hypothetical protein
MWRLFVVEGQNALLAPLGLQLLLLHSLCNTRGVAFCSMLGYRLATLFVFEFGPAAFHTVGFLTVVRGCCAALFGTM